MQVVGQYLKQSALFEFESSLCQRGRSEASLFAAYLRTGNNQKTVPAETKRSISFHDSAGTVSKTVVSNCEKSSLKTFVFNTVSGGAMCRMMTGESPQTTGTECSGLKLLHSAENLLLQHLLNNSLKENLKLESKTLSELTVLCMLLKKAVGPLNLTVPNPCQMNTQHLQQNCILPNFLPLCLLTQSRLTTLKRLLMKRKSYQQRRKEQEKAVEQERHDLMEQFCECFIR
ncbi:MAG: hypothetical protein J6M93_06210 [Succinivibrio sp.]|nr:hypothetical protein [Succinivibrio sp.]